MTTKSVSTLLSDLDNKASKKEESAINTISSSSLQIMREEALLYARQAGNLGACSRRELSIRADNTAMMARIYRAIGDDRAEKLEAEAEVLSDLDRAGSKLNFLRSVPVLKYLANSNVSQSEAALHASTKMSGAIEEAARKAPMLAQMLGHAMTSHSASVSAPAPVDTARLDKIDARMESLQEMIAKLAIAMTPVAK